MNIEIRRQLENDPPYDSQLPQHQGCCNLCPLPRSREQVAPGRPFGYPGRPAQPNPKIHIFSLYPNDLWLSLRQQQGPESLTAIQGMTTLRLLARKLSFREPATNPRQGFEKWGELAGSSSAQLVDLYPILQKLPDFVAPNVSYAKKLFAVERKNYVGYWMKSKQALDSGKGMVRQYS